MLKISVIICTHNPRMDYLTQVLDALKAQIMSFEQWELLLVDNTSDEALQDRIDLSWHRFARIIREDKLGLTPARLRGIKESVAELIVFVDDDNVLDSDYLERAFRISEIWPILGAWGGQILPSFEVPPPEWSKRYWGHLAIRQFERDVWSNLRQEGGTTPVGAGMVVRRSVAVAYWEKVIVDHRRSGLDRKGSDLTSGGDIDLAFTSVDIGLGTGLFTCLKLTHLISADRLTEKHLLNLEEKVTYSGEILGAIRGFVLPPARRSFLSHLRYFIQLLRMDKRSRRFELAKRRGLARARKDLQMLNSGDSEMAQ